MPEKLSSRSRKDANDGQVQRMRAGRLALVAGIVIFAAKFAAYLITGSTAVLADAMESTVNVVSAGMLVLALSIAGRPPDEDHPYGHGKVEFLSAAVEGAAIAFAALIIFAEGIRSLLAGSELRSLDLGLAVLGASAVANLLLGRYLTSVGQRSIPWRSKPMAVTYWPMSGRASASSRASSSFISPAGAGRIH